jgi:heterodisulfide reductase subunit D
MEMGLISSEFDQCIKCGLCLANCPVNHELFLEKYTPRGKIQLARRFALGEAVITDHYRDIFARCLLCGACSVTCPSGVNLTTVFTHMRKEITEERGISPSMKPAVDSLMAHHNISREDNAERGDWLEDMEGLPEHGYRKEKAKLVYFVGCVASFFPMAPGHPSEYGPHTLGGPCGFHGSGRRGMVLRLSLFWGPAWKRAWTNSWHTTWKSPGPWRRKCLFSCPSCHRMWREHYPNDFKLFHTTQFIEQLMDENALSFNAVPSPSPITTPAISAETVGSMTPPEKS